MFNLNTDPKVIIERLFFRTEIILELLTFGDFLPGAIISKKHQHLNNLKGRVFKWGKNKNLGSGEPLVSSVIQVFLKWALLYCKYSVILLIANVGNLLLL